MGQQWGQRRGGWRKPRIFYSPCFVTDMPTQLYSPVWNGPEYHTILAGRHSPLGQPTQIQTGL